jgi:hypothetical protein
MASGHDIFGKAGHDFERYLHILSLISDLGGRR